MRRWSRMVLVALVAAVPLAVPLSAAQAQQEWAYDETREIVNAGKDDAFDANVKVSATANLFNRQQVQIELDGFLPTYNANNTARGGYYHEYPVVVMQCRGTDPTPATCTNEYRSIWYPGYDAAASADHHDRARQIQNAGTTIGIPGDTFEEQKVNLLNLEQQPFTAADGVNYLWEPTYRDDSSPWINESDRKSYPPPDTSDAGISMIATRTIPVRADGTGEFLFEVRQRASQPSLGCTDTVRCSIVVVPIMDMACADDAPAACGGAPLGLAPGSTGAGPTTINPFLSVLTWFAESNWHNRFVVPISFAPDPDTCSVHDERPVVPVYGSELADVAQARWGSAYCAGARKTDYLPLYSQGSEYDGRRQFNSKLGDRYGQDAVLTTQPVLDSPRPVVHAPSALTGFTVAFTIDDAYGVQVRDLVLSPRLLAKLLTQSYWPTRVLDTVKNGRTLYTGTAEQRAAVRAAGNGNAFYWDYEALAKNPRYLFEDAEFLALNPDLRQKDADGRTAAQFLTGLTPVIFQVQSDIIVELTRYLTADPAARAWLDGEPDEQGMVVNPGWQGVRPFELYSLLDQTVRPPRVYRPESKELAPQHYLIPGAGDECDTRMRTPVLTRLANITNSAEAAATALLDRRGSASLLCTFTDVPVPPEEQPDPVPPGEDANLDRVYSESKGEPLEFGKRAMLAITTVPHARLYELPTAKLVNAGGAAVAPEPGTMARALAAAVQDGETGTVQLDHSRVTGNAYPGTMVAFTAAPTAGLAADLADNYADFIEFMATDGQVPGDGVTDLPPGYDPLTPNLRRQALDAAKAVREQAGEVPAPPEGGPLGGGADDVAGFGADPGGPDGTPEDTGPGGDAADPQGGDGADEDDPRAVAQTRGTDSWLSRWALPVLLAFGAAAALAAFVVGAATQPDHPARRFVRTMLRR